MEECGRPKRSIKRAIYVEVMNLNLKNQIHAEKCETIEKERYKERVE
jgi:hypothetical protein